MTYALLALVALAVGWVIGHRTARIRIIPVGAVLADDETALAAADEALLGEWSARLEQLTSPFDLPDDPKRPE